MFNFVAHEKNVHGKQMTLEVSNVDLYHPLNTGIYNVFLHEVIKNKDEQTWWYDDDSMTIHNKALKHGVLLEGANNNLVVYPFKNYFNQRFSY